MYIIRSSEFDDLDNSIVEYETEEAKKWLDDMNDGEIIAIQFKNRKEDI